MMWYSRLPSGGRCVVSRLMVPEMQICWCEAAAPGWAFAATRHGRRCREWTPSLTSSTLALDSARILALDERSHRIASGCSLNCSREEPTAFGALSVSRDHASGRAVFRFGRLGVTTLRCFLFYPMSWYRPQLVSVDVNKVAGVPQMQKIKDLPTIQFFTGGKQVGSYVATDRGEVLYGKLEKHILAAMGESTVWATWRAYRVKSTAAVLRRRKITCLVFFCYNLVIIWKTKELLVFYLSPIRLPLGIKLSISHIELYFYCAAWSGRVKNSL